ncbi:primosomal replication protein PriC [Volucribacter amazonae]|uniref:Restart primosome assembly protein PriC n=1 Tax=Volucribacter amazonae TaxID=256731 RepID=A0A9X4PF04_9PAST|nr:primosomal replication protein PriC [Volucribacter amazonae]MDG6896196.1 hypothetical protein [Volucribacter amazonae]
MLNKQQLVQRLSQQINQLYQQYQHQLDKKIFAKFDRTLFSESFATLSQYLQEIQQTLDQLATLQENAVQQGAFLTDKLLAQCRALTDALQNKPHYSIRKNPVATISASSTQGKQRKQDIHKLPPKQRLEKYYEALQALNNKLDEQVSLLYDAQLAQHKAYYQQQIEITQQRKKRCLEAIELLEEYLAYRQND